MAAAASGRRGLKRLHLGRGRSGPRALGQSCAASADASLGRGTCERDCGLKGSRCGLRPRRQCRMFCHVGRAGHGVRFRRRGGRLGEAAVSGNEGHLCAGPPCFCRRPLRRSDRCSRRAENFSLLRARETRGMRSSGRPGCCHLEQFPFRLRYFHPHESEKFRDDYPRKCQSPFSPQPLLRTTAQSQVLSFR